MMIKIGNQYLDFDDDIEVERQAKLFEELSTTDGDYSYQFEAPLTSHNIKTLGNPFPDNFRKLVYQKIDAQVIADDGQQLYDGFLRIEGITNVIKLAFFAGNNNWFGLLSGPLSDIDWSEFDIDQTLSNITVQMAAVSGVVFPLLDNGALITRGYRHLRVEDFLAGIYVHTVFKRIFRQHSIKIQGDLLTEPLYKKLITLRNGKSQDQIDANSSYIQKSTTTARPGENVKYKMTFQNDTVFPYYDGANNPFDLALSRYVAPVRERIKIEASFVPQIVDASYNQRIYLYINGAFTFVDIGLDAGGLYNSATPGDQTTFTLDRTIILEQGDVLEIYTEWQQSTGSTQNDVLSGSVKITPEYIYKAFGSSIVPPWTQQEYVSNILRIFNVLTHFNPVTKTLTFNLFDKLKSTEPIDLSEHVSEVEVDYIDFISSYGKRNILSYKEVEFEDPRQYNIQNFFKYGQGNIPSNNEFLEDSQDIVESDFSHPQSYINPKFDMSMERLNLITMETGDSTTGILVTDNAGSARFTVDQDIFQVGDLVRIESSNPFYNGDWIVTVRVVETAPGNKDGYIEFFGLPFDQIADDNTFTKLDYKYNESDDVYLLVQVPFHDVPTFSGYPDFRVEGFTWTFTSLAYFNLLQTGRQINEEFKQSLSFGEIEDPLFYQRTIVETYWGLVGRILNDPVKLLPIAHLPYNVFLKLDFLRSITIKTLETSNQYYLNRISGYRGSEQDCELQLIKLP